MEFDCLRGPILLFRTGLRDDDLFPNDEGVGCIDRTNDGVCPTLVLNHVAHSLESPVPGSLQYPVAEL
jgi:hypothetical protein